MSISRVQQFGGFNSAASGTSVASSTVTIGGGDTVLVAGSFQIAALTDIVTPTVTDSLGNSYTQSLSTVAPLGASSFFQVALFWGNIVVGGSGFLTLSVGAYAGAGRLRIHCQEVSGLDPSPLDVISANHSTTGTSMDSGAITTNFPNEFLHGYGMDNSGNPTPITPWNSGITEGSELDIWQIVSVTGTYHAQYTGDGADWICTVAGYKQLVAAAPPTFAEMARFGSRGTKTFGNIVG